MGISNKRRQDGADARAPGEIKRDQHGRFKAGHCPNPKGRPRKARPAIADVLLDIMHEEIPSGQGARAGSMTVAAAIARSVLKGGLSDPRIGLQVLQLVAKVAGGRAAAEDSETDRDVEEEILARYVSRHDRRRRTAGLQAEGADEGSEAEDLDEAEEDFEADENGSEEEP